MKDLIVGTHIWFAKKGVTIDGDVVSETVLPVFSSTEDEWLKLPSVEQWEPRTPSNFVTRRAPRSGGGKYGARVKIPVGGNDFIHAFNVQEFDKLLMQLHLNAASVNPSTGAYVVNSLGEPLVGWLHRRHYDQNDQLIDEADEWVQLSVEPFQFAENLNPHALLATVLNNVLNAGKITNLT